MSKKYKWMKDGAEFVPPLIIGDLAYYSPTYEQLAAVGYVLTDVTPAPKPVTVKDYDRVLEKHIRDTRVKRGYTDREPTMYLNSTNLRWKQDAEDWTKFIDEVMTYGLEIINRFESGGKVPPLNVFKAKLPKIDWTFKDLKDNEE